MAGGVWVAFDDATLDPYPTWTRIDSYDNLVASYAIDRGRQYELDRTDAGHASIEINDVDGILDPTNASGPYYGKIEPLLQCKIERWNPVTSAWNIRFRGFIEDYDYVFDPSQRVNKLTLGLCDIFEILSAIEMYPGEFGDTPDAGSEGQIQFDAAANMAARIDQALGDFGLDAAWADVFSGNVSLIKTVYSPGESVMTVIQEAADGEFPGVSNVFTDRYGRLAVHGREAKHDPIGVASVAPSWDFHSWQAGDGATVAGNPAQFAHIRTFAFNRGLSKIINKGLATPADIDDADVNGQIYSDATSISQYGIRSWSAQNLLTDEDSDAAAKLVATKRFAQFYVDNYKTPQNRVTDISFRSMAPNHSGASENWRLLSQVDIGDTIEVTIASPGGGGFTDEQYFVEGVHEEVRPLNATYDDITLRLDLSPRSVFDDATWPFPS